MRLSGIRTNRTDVRAHVDGIRWFPVRRDQDVGALTRPQGDNIGCIWLDGYIIYSHGTV